jgi:tetratricopeptide (TPR) repeat protein
MPGHQDQFDDAMFAFSTGDYAAAIAGLKAILAEDPAHFDAQLSLGMAYYRLGDYATAIIEGHKAEQLRPQEQLVHTNLSLFYMKSGNKQVAEHHGLQARIASWRGNMSAPGASPAEGDPELAFAQPKPQPVKLPEKFPDMPWKKNAKAGATAAPASMDAPSAKPAETKPDGAAS